MYVYVHIYIYIFVWLITTIIFIPIYIYTHISYVASSAPERASRSCILCASNDMCLGT